MDKLSLEELKDMLDDLEENIYYGVMNSEKTKNKIEEIKILIKQKERDDKNG